MVCGSGCAGVAVPWVTSMRTRNGRMMCIPISTGGDSRPMITMKLTLPLASPHCSFRCWVFPAIWSGLPCAPWTTPSKGFKGPHWARYYHHTKNPMQVTEVPDGPGEIGVPNSYWLLTWDAVEAESTRRSGDASSKLSWVAGWFQAEVLETANLYWPLTSAGSLNCELNFHWLMAQVGSRGQPRGMLNFH